MKTIVEPGKERVEGDDAPERGVFKKVDGIQCLYQYSANGKFYALLKHQGKQKRQSLKTDNLEEAKRKLRDAQSDIGKLDFSQSKLTLRELTNRYLKTIQNQAPATIYRKEHIVERLVTDFPGGPDMQVSKIRQSSLETWLAKYTFGYASHTLYVLLLKALFDMAVNDKVIAASPAEKIECKKHVKPVRITPSFEDFEAIIADVRKQRCNADAQDSADFLEFMGLIGVGQAEAGRIQKQHVNLTKKQLIFFRVKTRTPYVVPIFPQAEALVNKLHKTATKPTDVLFPVHLKKSINKANSTGRDGKKALAAACKRLGLPAYTQRSLRRMFITRCIEKGIDVKVIASWQGHQDGGKLILGTYSHVRNTHAEEMAKLLT